MSDTLFEEKPCCQKYLVFVKIFFNDVTTIKSELIKRNSQKFWYIEFRNHSNETCFILLLSYSASDPATFFSQSNI